MSCKDQLDPADGIPDALTDIRRPLERVGKILATAAVFFMLVYAAGVIFVVTSGLAGGDSRQVDFAALWAAARMLLAGNPIAAFDTEALRAAQALPSDALPENLLWLYPPGMQFLLAPFGLLPYWAAWLAFGLLSLAAFATASWRLAAPVPMGHDLLIAAPIVIITLQLGQVSLLWTAGLVFALHRMARGDVVLAGLVIGMLSLKPQLGLLLPFALVAARRWGVMLSACVAALLVHGLPTLAVGVEYWEKFFARMEWAAAAMRDNGTRQDLMVSPYAFFRLLGSGHDASMALQLGVSLLLVIFVSMLWNGWRRRPYLMIGALMMAIPLATPYAYYYELTVCVAGAIFLVRGGYGSTAPDRLLLAGLLFAPIILFVRTELAPLLMLFPAAVFARSSWFAFREPVAIKDAPAKRA